VPQQQRARPALRAATQAAENLKVPKLRYLPALKGVHVRRAGVNSKPGPARALRVEGGRYLPTPGWPEHEINQKTFGTRFRMKILHELRFLDDQLPWQNGIRKAADQSQLEVAPCSSV